MKVNNDEKTWQRMKVLKFLKTSHTFKVQLSDHKEVKKDLLNTPFIKDSNPEVQEPIQQQVFDQTNIVKREKRGRKKNSMVKARKIKELLGKRKKQRKEHSEESESDVEMIPKYSQIKKSEP